MLTVLSGPPSWIDEERVKVRVEGEKGGKVKTHPIFLPSCLLIRSTDKIVDKKPGPNHVCCQKMLQHHCSITKLVTTYKYRSVNQASLSQLWYTHMTIYKSGES